MLQLFAVRVVVRGIPAAKLSRLFTFAFAWARSRFFVFVGSFAVCLEVDVLSRQRCLCCMLLTLPHVQCVDGILKAAVWMATSPSRAFAQRSDPRDDGWPELIGDEAI